MTNYARILIGLLLISSACTESQKETPNGFKYSVIKEGDGVLPQKQEILVFEYVLKDSKDSIWNDTYKQGIPAAVPIGDTSNIRMEKGMIGIFRMLSKGDSVKASMPIKKFFEEIGGGPAPFKIDSTLTMSYIIKVTAIMTREKFQEFQATLMDKMKTTQVTKDADLITKYLTDKNIKAEKDSSGIMYVIHKNKGGAKPTAESCVEVNYKGAFLEDGQIFDQNPKMAFPLAMVIPGWQKAIPLIGIGDSATFYIPSALAYGPQGQPGAIPPNAILIFDVSLLGIGTGFDQNTRTCK